MAEFTEAQKDWIRSEISNQLSIKSTAYVAKAVKANLTPVVSLNGTRSNHAKCEVKLNWNGTKFAGDSDERSPVVESVGY